MKINKKFSRNHSLLIVAVFFGITGVVSMLATSAMTERARDGETPVNVATSNIYKSNTDAQKKAVVQKARGTGAAIIGFQEAGSYNTTLGDKNWDRITGATAGTNQLAYRSDLFKLVRAKSEKLQPPVKNQPNCGRIFENAITATGGLFESKKTGQRFIIINTHLQQSAFQDGKECLRPYWNAQADRLLEFANSFPAEYPSIILGDLNRPQSFDWTIGKYTNHRVPATHGLAHYDRILTRGDVLFGNVRVVPTASDHDTLKATVTFKTR